MAPQRSLLSIYDTRNTRRRFLAAMGIVAGVSTAGCNELVPSFGREGEGDTIEVLVENRTEELAQVGVRLEGSDGDALFSRVYEIEPGHLDSTAGIETPPTMVSVFTPDGTSATWEYAPGSDLDCEGQDIGITLKGDSEVESWYAC